MAVDLVLKLYTLLDNLNAPRFANCRLHLPCIVFPVSEVIPSSIEDTETYSTYKVKADGLHDLKIATQCKLPYWSRKTSTRQPLLLVRPWDRHLLELPDYIDTTESVDDNDFALSESSA
jgi:hypothetical protein